MQSAHQSSGSYSESLSTWPLLQAGTPLFDAELAVTWLFVEAVKSKSLVPGKKGAAVIKIDLFYLFSNLERGGTLNKKILVSYDSKYNYIS